MSEKKRKLSDEFVVDDKGSENSEEEYKEGSKREKKERKKGEEKKLKPIALKNSDNDFYWNIGGLKRITTRKWKNMKLLDIREYYKEKESGEEKPGKKGITLTLEQWNKLKELISEVDDAFEEMGKK